MKGDMMKKKVFRLLWFLTGLYILGVPSSLTASFLDLTSVTDGTLAATYVVPGDTSAIFRMSGKVQVPAQTVFSVASGSNLTIDIGMPSGATPHAFEDTVITPDPAVPATGSIIVFDTAPDAEINIYVDANTLFTANIVTTTPNDPTTYDAAASRPLTIVVRGQGIVTLKVAEAVRVDYGAAYLSVAPAANNNYVDYTTAGVINDMTDLDGLGNPWLAAIPRTRFYVTMDQTYDAVVNGGEDKLIFARSNVDRVYADPANFDDGADDTGLYFATVGIRRHAVLSPISTLATGIVDDEFVQETSAGIGFDTSNPSNNQGRLCLEIGGASDVSFRAQGCGSDGAFHIYGVLLTSDGVSTPAPNFTNLDNIRDFVVHNQIAGGNVTVHVYDFDISEQLLEGDDLQQVTGLLIQNNCRSIPALAADLYSVSELGIAHNSDFMQVYTGPNTPQPGFILGVNGTIEVGHNTFIDYVSNSGQQLISRQTTSPNGALPGFPDVLATGFPQLDAALIEINTANAPDIYQAQDVLKLHSPSAFIVDGLMNPFIALTPQLTQYIAFDQGETQAGIYLYGNAKFYLRNGSQEGSTVPNSRIEVDPETGGDIFVSTYDPNIIGEGFYDGNTLALDDTSVETLGEGGEVFSVNGPLFMQSLATDLEDGSVYFAEGEFNLSSYDISWYGTRFNLDIILSAEILTRDLLTPLQIYGSYRRNNKPYMSVNDDIQLVSMTWNHDDVTHFVSEDNSSEPTYVGGEALVFNEALTLSSYEGEQPVISIVNTDIDVHQDMALSGFFLEVTDYDTEDEEDPIEANFSAINFYNHGDDNDTYTINRSRCLSIGTDGNVLASGDSADVLDSARLFCYRSSNFVSDDDVANPVAKVSLATYPESNFVATSQRGTQVINLANKSNINLGWPTSPVSFIDLAGDNTYPWLPFDYDEAADVILDPSTNAPATLIVEGDHFYFGGQDRDGFPPVSPVPTADEPAIIYANFGALFGVLESTSEDEQRRVYFDTIIAGKIGFDSKKAIIDGYVSIPFDQLKMGANASFQPWGLDVGEVLVNSPGLNIPVNTLESFFNEMTIPWGNIYPTLNFAPVKGFGKELTRGTLAGAEVATSSPKRKSAAKRHEKLNGFDSKAKASKHRYVIPNTAPVAMPTGILEFGPSNYLEQVRVSGSTSAHPVHLYFTGNFTSLGYSQVREFTSEESTPFIAGEGMYGAFFMDNGARVGLGSREWDQHSVYAWNKLGREWLTLYPNGNCVIELNNNITIQDPEAIVATTNFGNVANGLSHRITFYSEESYEIRVPTGQEFDLSSFGQPTLSAGRNGVGTQEIAISGKVRLVFEQGSTLRFPNLAGDQKAKAPILLVDEEAEIVFEGVMDREKEDKSELNFYRTSIVGVGKIHLTKNGKIKIFDEALVGIVSETNSDTDLVVNLDRDSQFLIGDDNNKGGSLEIGNIAPVTGSGITFRLELDGNNCLFNVGQFGFFGIGAGVDSQPEDYVNSWTVAQRYSVDSIYLSLVQGTFSHNQIENGDQRDVLGDFAEGSLWAIGPVSGTYTIEMSPGVLNTDAAYVDIRGGGNILYVPAGADEEIPTVFDLTQDGGIIDAVGPYAVTTGAYTYNLMGSGPIVAQKTTVPNQDANTTIITIPQLLGSNPLLVGGKRFNGNQLDFYKYVGSPAYADMAPHKYVPLGSSDRATITSYTIQVPLEAAISGYIAIRTRNQQATDSNGFYVDTREALDAGVLGAAGAGDGPNRLFVLRR